MLHKKKPPPAVQEEDSLVDSKKFIYGVEITEKKEKKMEKRKKKIRKKLEKKLKKIWEQFCTHHRTILHENPHPQKTPKFKNRK